MTNTSRLALVVLPSLLSFACAGTDSATTGTWQATQDTIGDTVVVRTSEGAVWDTPMTLVDDLVIGELEGAPEYTFGLITGIAPDDSGGVFLFDNQAKALRYYDATGRYVRTIGGSGAGPGEYEEVLGIRLRGDGRLVLRDPDNARVVIYERDGTPIAHIPVASGLYTSNSLIVDSANHMYLAVLTGEIERNRPWPIGFEHRDPDGEIVDTLHAPAVANEPDGGGWTFSTRKEWMLAPDRTVVVGVTDRYSIELRRPDGRVLRIERDVEPVAVLAEERAELEATNDWIRQRQAQHLTSDIPPVPDTKPLWKDLLLSDRGELWVQRHVTAEKAADADTTEQSADQPPAPTWREPGVFDVFDREGRYLGEVRAPRRTSVIALRGDYVWGFRFGEFDEPYVVRMRLEPATDAAE
ncbi:MAG TPA: 6-bladed beta-propeller [Longimicrobiales bacterium]